MTPLGCVVVEAFVDVLATVGTTPEALAPLDPSDGRTGASGRREPPAVLDRREAAGSSGDS